jgi:hypothetical protein
MLLDKFSYNHLLTWTKKSFSTEAERAYSLGLIMYFLSDMDSEELAFWLDAGWWKVYDAAKLRYTS